MNPQEIIGQLYMQLQNEAGSHRQTLQMLMALKRGEILLEHLFVTDEAWRLEKPPEDNGADESESEDEEEAPASE